MPSTYPIAWYLYKRYACSPTWSTDGLKIAFLSNESGSTQVWCIDREGCDPVRLTATSGSCRDVVYAPYGNRLLIHQEKDGTERGQMYLLDLDTRRLRLLSMWPGVNHTGIWAPDGEHVIFKANRRHPAYFDLYRISQAGGEPELLFQSNHLNTMNSFSPDGRYLLFTRQRIPLANGIYLLDLETREAHAVTSSDTEAAHSSIQWARHGRGLYLLSNRERAFRNLAYLDLSSGSLQWLVEMDWDLESVRVSPNGRTLAYTANVGGRSELFLRDEASGASRSVALPSGVIGQIAWAPDSATIAFALDGESRPLNIWICEVASGNVRQLTNTTYHQGIPNEALLEPELVSYLSFDGLRVPAWLYFPPSARPQGGFPAVVYVHGGPESQTRASYHAFFQIMLNHGYVVLAPNIRGSSGYGTGYSSLDDGRKRMDAVADVAAAAAFLAETGEVNLEKIAVTGGSYGGFVTLASLTRYPNLWAAGICTSGISNFETFLERTSPHRRHLREHEYGSLEHDRAFLREISPVWHVDKIRAPLLVIHGENDPRVPPDEARQIVDALRNQGGVVEFLLFPNEGHGLSKKANQLTAYQRIMAFLDKNIANGLSSTLTY